MEINLKNIRIWYLWAALCFVPALFFYYTGEEGVFTLNTMEMWQHKVFDSVFMYGVDGGRPPLFSWLMMPVAYLIGWEHILVASRIVTVASTIGTSLIIGWLAQQLWRDKSVSWMAALLYLITADVLLYRGWQSYADPLFSMFTVLSMATVWGACLKRSYWLIVGSMLAAFAAFLTKALTVYVFLGITMLVLLSDANFRKFLLNWRTFLIFALGVIPPLLWLKMGTHDAGQGGYLVQNILDKLAIPNIREYLVRLLTYPLTMMARLMPLTLFVGYFLVYQREVFRQQPAVRLALLIALLNYLPYLLAPQGSVRYVTPIYPFVVLAAAYLVVHRNHSIKVKKWIIGMLVLGTLGNGLLFPLYQKIVRGENYVQMATEIMESYGQYPLYVKDLSSVGLSVAANIDSMNFDRPALTLPPPDFTNGIVIARMPEDVEGTLLRTLRVNDDVVYLICRGAACAARK